MFDAGIVLNIGLIYRRGAMGTATTPATVSYTHLTLPTIA